MVSQIIFLFEANYQLKLPDCLAILLDLYLCTTNESSNIVELGDQLDPSLHAVFHVSLNFMLISEMA